MGERIGDWIQTYTGRKFWPLDPRAEEIDILDVAMALSKKCRYTGHCLHFYSVAEHSVLMSRHAAPADKLWALLHDASEAYLPDVARPVKRDLVGFNAIEERVQRAVAQRFSLPWPIPPSIHILDTRICSDEMGQNMAPPPAPWRHDNADNPLGVKLKLWPPGEAAVQFLGAFNVLWWPRQYLEAAHG
jgi:hypothetical protein